MLSLLTLNIQAAALPRAQRLQRWLLDRDDDVVILTETSSGPGTTYLVDRCHAEGFAVVSTPSPGDRGVVLLSRLPITPRYDLTVGVTPPGRATAITLRGPQEITVLGVYVPSSDRAPDKLRRKQTFVGGLLHAIDSLDPSTRSTLIMGGDYNVITRDHQPTYRGFLPFEYGLLDTLHAHGLADAHQHCSPGVQAHSWFGRAGNGYRFDYFHTGAALTDRIRACDYLTEPRDLQLSDHAAVSLTIELTTGRRRPASPTATEAGTLF